MRSTISIKEALHKNIVFFDGATGTEIYKQDVFVNQNFDNLNIVNPNIIKKIHQSYVDVGSQVITTNTYGANRIELAKFGLEEQVAKINKAGVQIAREVADKSEFPIFVAGDIGPGSTNGITEENNLALKEQIQILVESDVDFIIFETLPNRAAAENCVQAITEVAPKIPFIISVKPSLLQNEQCDSDFVRIFSPFPEHLSQPIAWGLNCGHGPAIMLTHAQKLIKKLNIPLIIQPNAGEYKDVGGRQLSLTSPEYFTSYSRHYLEIGSQGLGGCCGITPEHIKEMIQAIRPLNNHNFKPNIEATPLTLELKEETQIYKRSRLGYKLHHKQWIETVEIMPPTSYDLSQVIQKAKICARAGIDCINIPDGPRASARISPFFTALQIQKESGIETTIHVCARDRNLISIQADLLACAGGGVNNILLVTGDPPKLGKYPFASAVFDVNAVGLTTLQKRLNQGVDLAGQEINPQTNAVIGVGVDPNALDIEHEIEHLRKKIDAGAEFITTQPVFEADVFFKFLDKIKDINTPIIAGIWPLASLRNATFMKNEVPGVVVSDWIIEKMASFKSKEDQCKMGVEIAKITVDKLRSQIAGVQVSAPFGNVETAISVLR